MSSQVDPKIIVRLKSLLSLANHERTGEAEAQLAMQRAQELMFKHNLTMATIEAQGAKAEGRLKDRADKNLMFKWQRELFAAVARVNFCYFTLLAKVTRGGEKIAGGYEIIGRESNVIAARNMYDYLSQAIARMVRDECGPSSSDQFTKFANSFRLGCVARLAERLNERHRATLAEQSRQAREANAAARHPEAATTNALVIVMDDFAQAEADANEDVRLGQEIGTTARKRKEREARWAKEDRERAEKKAELVRQGIPEDVATYMAYGYDQAQAEQLAKPSEPKKETEAQKRKREEREARQDARDQARREARAQREARKIDPDGYWKGHEAGGDIGLDDQVDHQPRKRLG